MTDSAFPTLTTDEQIFHDLVWIPMLTAGETWLEGAVPVLALPVIKQVDEAALGAIARWLFNQLVLIVDITAIKLVNAAHQSAYDSASLQLKIVSEESGVNSDAYRQAQAKALSALSAFTNMSP